MRSSDYFPLTEDLAAEAFAAHERVKAMMMMNEPYGYEERKKAAVALALAQEAAFQAQKRLDERLRGEAP